EGKRAVAEALEAGVPVRRAFVAARPHGQDPTVARLVASMEERGIEVEEVSKATLDAISYHGTHQGIALETEPFAYADIHEVIEAAGTGDALVLCLDHVTDEGNLGAIARSAECAGAAGIVIPNRRAAAVGPGAYKTSAGALAHLKVARVPNMATAVDDLKKAGFWAVCATEHAEQGVWESDLSGRVCLV
ncbi:RNA methyltransferase, TrmH family, group 3, partial [gut metagenome]